MTLKLGKLSKTKIKEACFECLKENGFTVTDVEIGNGYFIFDLGQNSVVHFKIKEIPYWKFGLWIIKDTEKNEYTVQFFGDKIDWIDKFKPSRSTITSAEDSDEADTLPLVVTKKNQNSYCSLDMAVFGELNVLKRLKKNRRIAEYGLSDTSRGFFKWLFEEIWYYDIQKPWEEFYEAHIVGALYKLIIKYIAFRFRKYVKAREVIDRGDNVYPRYETGVEYLNVDDENTKTVWWNIQEMKLVKFLNKYSNFGQFMNKDDHRGFCYPEYYEWKKQEREKKNEEIKNKLNK